MLPIISVVAYLYHTPLCVVSQFSDLMHFDVPVANSIARLLCVDYHQDYGTRKPCAFFYGTRVHVCGISKVGYVRKRRGRAENVNRSNGT